MTKIQITPYGSLTNIVISNCEVGWGGGKKEEERRGGKRKFFIVIVIIVVNCHVFIWFFILGINNVKEKQNYHIRTEF